MSPSPTPPARRPLSSVTSACWYRPGPSWQWWDPAAPGSPPWCLCCSVSTTQTQVSGEAQWCSGRSSYIQELFVFLFAAAWSSSGCLIPRGKGSEFGSQCPLSACYASLSEIPYAYLLINVSNMIYRQKSRICIKNIY